MKWMLSVFLFIALISPVFAEEFNAGFVQGLWYDSEQIFVDKPVRIYVAIRNNTNADLTGTVEFFDNDKRIERNNVSALNGRIIESWADWTPSFGSHTISATLSRIELHTVGSSTQAVEVVSALAEDTIFVDFDTDGDGQANEKDKDDDGDGKSDKEEAEAGTDPLVYDKPAEDESEEDSSNSSSNENNNSNDNNNETQSDSTTAVNRGSGSDSNEGLERFLTPSRADTVFTGVTEVINTTKKKIDLYRDERTARIHPDLNPDVEVNEDGFGEILRTSEEEKKAEESKPVAEKPTGFFGDILTVVGNILSGIFTGVLAVFSWFLGHPVLVQLTLLFLILFILFKIARRLGRRPQ